MAEAPGEAPARLHNIKSAQERLSVSRSTIFELIGSGQLRSVRALGWPRSGVKPWRRTDQQRHRSHCTPRVTVPRYITPLAGRGRVAHWCGGCQGSA
jgi:predicted DNA-binding transcriptional regulator AlpA